LKKLLAILVLAAALVPSVVAAAAPLVVGDANMDGKVSMADVLAVLQYRAGDVEFTADQLRCADTTADGKVTMADALHIMQFRADPHGTLGILHKPLYDPVFHAGMVDPLTL
jgi:hypothetical protein